MLPDLRPRGVGEILDVAVTIFRARFGPLVRVAFLVALPAQVITVLVLWSTTPDPAPLAGIPTLPHTTTTTTTDAGEIWLQIAGSLVIIATTWLATTFVTAYATRVVAGAYIDSTETVSEAFRAVNARIGKVLGLGLTTSVLVAIGGGACGIPGLVLQVFFCVAMPAFVLEGTGVFRALGRSAALTKPKWWQCAGVYLTGSLLASALAVGLAIAISLLTGHFGSGSGWDALSQGAGNLVATTFTTPYLATALVVLYLDLRIRAEGFDVQLMLTRLDAHPTVAPTTAR
jgi:hypothetical protein